MRYQILVLATIVLVSAGCITTESYDFRSQERPTYDRAIDVGELENLSNDETVTLLDVRLLEDYQSDPVLIPGATYSDPDQIETWASAIPDNSKVVVYCVRGAWVSQKAATYLSGKGLDVYTLGGGIEAWQETQQN